MSEVVEFKFHDDDALNRNMLEQQSMRAAAQGNLGLATDLAHAAALYALASAISGISQNCGCGADPKSIRTIGFVPSGPTPVSWTGESLGSHDATSVGPVGSLP
jgi:hypothetical protein